MSDRIQTIAAIAVSSIALVVVVIGLAAGPAAEPTPEDRVAALSDQIVCPFCSGESLADSGSGVAADYRVLIEELVSNGYSDDEILDEFAANFGESYVLDGSGTTTTILLWVIPALLVAGGVLVFAVMKRSSTDAEVAP